MGLTTTIAITTTTTVRSRRCSIMIMIVVVILFFFLLLLLHFIFQSIRFFNFYSYSLHCCDDVFIYISLSFVERKYRSRLPVLSSSTIYFCVVVFGSREFFGLSVSQKALTVLHFIGRERIFHSRIMRYSLPVLPTGTPLHFHQSNTHGKPYHGIITYSEYHGIGIGYKV